MKGISPIAAFDKLELFPIGSIYTSINSTSPATLFGGTWEQIQGRFLLSASSSYTAGGTGGAPTVNLSHVHSTGNHTLTIDEMPSHNHTYRFDMNNSVNWYIGLSGGTVDSNRSAIASGPQGRSYTMNINNTGGNAAHNHGNTGSNLSSSQSIMPPYLVVYMWKRTA